MATYKVIQDIEAEDKILGPLTLRQFVYGLITAFLLYICFICITAGAPYLLIIALPPAIFTGFFTFPFGRDQPTEVWATARIRFLFKPRRRIWNQSGIKELVTITVPKKEIPVLTNGLSQNEVQSRLQVLAKTIDSRGWAVKNVNLNLYTEPSSGAGDPSDRLLQASSMPQEVPSYDVQASDDILDSDNAVAHQFDQMIDASEQSHRKQLVDEMNSAKPATRQPAPATPDDYWFLNQPVAPPNMPASQSMFAGGQVVQPGADDTAAPAQAASAEEEALAARLKAQNASSKQQAYYSHLRTIQPLGSQPQPPAGPGPSDNTVQAPVMPVDDRKAPTNSGQTMAQPVDDTQADTSREQAAASSAPQHDPAILSLANNNDLNVATLAREAYKVKNPGEPPQDEVVISLH